jgi:nucleoside-diphosphate-sugar epimerase
MRIAITGAQGYIGQNLLPRLTALGHDIVEISRSNGFDLMTWESVRDIPKCDIIIHLAAKTSVPESFKDPRFFYQTNLTLTINALELSRLWSSKVIFMSSYFYGPPQYTPVDEIHPLRPHNPYAQTKFLSEQICEAFHRDFGVPILAFRLFNIYGPNQPGSFLISEILQKISSGGVVVLKDPRPRRDYIYIEDVLSGIESAINFESKSFDVFNLGTGKSISVLELLNTIHKMSPIKFEFSFTNEFRQGEVLESVADIKKINQVLNWTPKFDIETGLNKLLKVNTL